MRLPPPLLLLLFISVLVGDLLSILESIISAFIELANTFFEYIFGGVQFSVLWSWLPSDIGSAALSFISILFGIALIAGIRRFLPF